MMVKSREWVETVAAHALPGQLSALEMAYVEAYLHGFIDSSMDRGERRHAVKYRLLLHRFRSRHGLT